MDFEIKDGVFIKYHGIETDIIIPEGVTDFSFSAIVSIHAKAHSVIHELQRLLSKFAFNGH